MYDLTGFQRDLLYVIAGEDEPHGLAIKDELEQFTRRRSITVGSIPISTPSSTRGLVEKGRRDRRTNFYTLTRRGRRELEARREWETQYVEL